jgi:hypothetical protein
MNAFLDAITYKDQAILVAANGDVYRVWFGWGEPHPFIERLILDSASEYRVVIDGRIRGAVGQSSGDGK